MVGGICSSSWSMSARSRASRVRTMASAATMPTSAVSSTIMAVNRRRIIGGSRVPPEHVAEAAHGVDQRGVVAVDLLAQVGDVVLDHARLAGEVVVPHVV